MNTLLQSHVQRHIGTHRPVSKSNLRHYQTIAPVKPVAPVPTPEYSQDTQALLLFDTQRTLAVANGAATSLLNVQAEMARGQSIDYLAGGMLASVPLRPTALRASSEFFTADGRLLLATSRLLKSSGQQFAGWMVGLQETTESSCTGLNATIAYPAIELLQKQINALRELIGMLPQFSHHHYWRHLLSEHMERLTDEMEAEVQRLAMRPC